MCNAFGIPAQLTRPLMIDLQRSFRPAHAGLGIVRFCTFTEISVNTPNGSKHGYMIPIPQEELKMLLEKYQKV